MEILGRCIILIIFILICTTLARNGGFNRDCVEELGRMDVPHNRDDPNNEWGYGKVKWNQTRRQFFETIDRVVEEESISEELQKLQTAREKGNKSKNLRKLWRLVFPVYVRLREIGYEHWDLCG